MIAAFMPPLYVAALYIVARLANLRGNARHAVIIDAMALNWLACSLANEGVDYPRVVAAYLVIDVVTALWISMRVKGKVAGIVEMFYIAIILFNGAFFFRHAFDSMTHWTGLSILSWGQLAFVAGGIVRHDLVKLANRVAAGLGLQRLVAFGNKEAGK